MKDAFLALGLLFEESPEDASVTLTPAHELFQFPAGTPLRIRLSIEAEGIMVTRTHVEDIHLGELSCEPTIDDALAEVLVELTQSFNFNPKHVLLAA